ncbi:MAG: division/cell wall cluster transcriptional repressor MraZ [Planctomycetota bacterium]
MLFTGKSELSIDAKHRMAIPAKIRAGLDPQTDGEAFYIIQGANGALWLWPERTFRRIAGEVEPTLAPAAAIMDFNEITFPEAQRLDIDTAGRVRIPEEMLADAQLGSRVLLLGVRDHLEIWDPGRWDTHRSEKVAKRPEIVQRAHDLMPGPEHPGYREPR